jgi:excisionase family DNA binding protein
MMTEIQSAEFRAFCHRDGLSPSGTDAKIWQAARPLGLLVAIWAVHHHEIPSGECLENLQSLERYARPLLPTHEGEELEGTYLTTGEVAEVLDVTQTRVRQLVAEDRLTYITTPLGRLFSPESVEAYRTSMRQSPGRPPLDQPEETET